MFKYLVLLLFTVSCQTSPSRIKRNVASKDLNEYSNVVRVWNLTSKNSADDILNSNVFFNDYLKASTDRNPVSQLVYYFENSSFTVAAKLIIDLNESTTLDAEFFALDLALDESDCTPKKIANEDWRRQSCYIERADAFKNREVSIDDVHGFVIEELNKLLNRENI